MKLYLQKNSKFSSAGGSAPRPPCLRRLGAWPPKPQPPAAGGFAPRPPLASGGWGLRPQTPQTAPPHCEFLATRLLHNISLMPVTKDNGESEIIKVAKELDVKLESKDIYKELTE